MTRYIAEHLRSRALLLVGLMVTGMACGAAPRTSFSLPLHFEPGSDGTMVAKGVGYALSLHGGTASIAVRAGQRSQDWTRLRLRHVGAAADAALSAAQPMASVSHYLRGASSRVAVPHYGQVTVQQLYPGIDLVFYGNQESRLEHDYQVAPGADPSVIRLAVEGARAELDRNGDALLRTGGPTLRLLRPVAYQEAAGQRQEVPVRFVLDGSGQLGFALGSYDRARLLVIDPVLVYGTYLGGGGDDVAASAVAATADGGAVVAGYTSSADFPGAAGAINGYEDAFVCRFDPAGALLWSTYLGGGDSDRAFAVALGTDGSPYVTGVTSSVDFPGTAGSAQSALMGSANAFVARLSADGSSLPWATYLGGSFYEEGRGIVVDANGNAVVTGTTVSWDFPQMNAFQPAYGESQDAFVTAVSSDGTALRWSSYLGGEGSDELNAIAKDGSDHLYVTGVSSSTMLPPAATWGAQAALPGQAATIVARISVAGDAPSLDYLTYLGGSGEDPATTIASAGGSAVYVGGSARSSNFPVTDCIGARGGYADGFVAKIDTGTAGTASVVWCYRIGGAASDWITSLSASGGQLAVTGVTDSTDYPTVDPLQPALAGGFDAFIIWLGADGSLQRSTYYGGGDSDWPYGIALDSSGNAIVVGTTSSSDLPLRNPVCPTLGGTSDAFVAKLTNGPSPVLTVTSSDLAPTTMLPNTWTPMERLTLSAAGDDFTVAGLSVVESGSVPADSASLRVCLAGSPVELTSATFDVPTRTWQIVFKTPLAISAGSSVALELQEQCSAAAVGADAQLTVPSAVGMADGRTVAGSFPFKSSKSRVVSSATALSFNVGPTDTSINSTMACVEVSVVDEAGQVAPGSTAPITLSLTGGPAGATLSGTLTRNAVAGVAKFTDLKVSQPGTGYCLVAASAGLTSATSTAFAIVNHPPAANAGPDRSVEQATPAGSSVLLDGSGSTDADGDPLTYTWAEGANTLAGPSTQPKATVLLACGVHTITLTVKDSWGATSSDTVVVTVADTTPPVVTIQSPQQGAVYLSSGGCLPIRYTVSDAGDPAPTAIVYLDGQPYSLPQLPLADLPYGPHTIAVVTQDRAGNRGSSQVQFIVQPAGLCEFEVKHLHIDWDNNWHHRCQGHRRASRVTVRGEFGLPPGFTPNMFKQDATVMIEIGGRSGTDTVLFNHKACGPWWRWGEDKWKVPEGSNLDLGRLGIRWGKGSRPSRFALDGELGPDVLDDGSGVVTVTLFLHLKAGGELAGTDTVKCRIHSDDWIYNDTDKDHGR